MNKGTSLIRPKKRRSFAESVHRAGREEGIRFRFLVCLGFVLVACFSAVQATGQEFDLEIPAATADEALKILARQTGYSILYQSDEVRSARTRPIAGRMDIERALSLMLQNTSLSFGLSEGDVITVTAALPETNKTGEESMSSSGEKSTSFLKHLATALAISFSPQVLAQSDSGTEMVLEEVVVTATKRGAENLLDVPIAISAFGGDFIEDQGFNGVYDFLQLAPGVSSLTFAPGLNRIQMRGVSVGVGENNVGFYVDEVPLSFINQANLPDVRSFDVERVEVLRGPQSTLYGAGALAGVVRTVTRDPVLDSFGFAGDFSLADIADGGSTYDGNVAFNAPIVKDRLAVRAVYSQENQDGWIDQTVLGKKDYNDSDFKNFRLKLLGQVTDNLNVSLMYWNSQIDTLSTPASFKDRTNNEAAETPSNYDYDIYNLTIDYSGESVGVVSATSYAELDTLSTNDFILGFTLESILDPATFTQEVRVFSKNEGMWQWTAGGFYRDADQTQIQQSDFLIILGLDPVIQYDKVKSSNLFAELTGTFLDGKLDFTAGARYIDEERTSENQVRPTEPYTNDFSEVVPRFNATYRPQENWMTYFNFSQGFRSGINQFAISLETAAAFGVDLPLAADPEFADSYEWGIKGSFLDNRLTLDAVAFYLKWKDLQTIVPVISGLLSGVVNAAEAESPGVEVALNWLATERLTLGVMGSWNDAQYSSDVYAEALVLDPSTGLPSDESVEILVVTDGDRLNDVPEWTAGATLNYVKPMSNGMEFVTNASAQFAGARETRASGPVAEGDSLLTADLRVGLNMGRWGAYLFAKNLFDEDGIISPITTKQNFGYRYTPRTVGVNVRFTY